MTHPVPEPQAIDVNELIARGAVETWFQPIVSVRSRRVIGVEALSRARTPAGDLIPPGDLFFHARARGRTIALDRLCRARALDAFAPLHRADPRLILFINVDAETVLLDADEASDPDRLDHQVERAGIDPRCVALEVLETEFPDAGRLRDLTRHHRERGFLVALDDVGAGHSNLDRITYVRPDILKADRALVEHLDRDVYKQEVLLSLVRLAERIGGWAIVEGVETQNEALAALDLGADMVQGYHFARPAPGFDFRARETVLARAGETARAFKEHALRRAAAERQEKTVRARVARDVAARLSQAAGPNEFTILLESLLAERSDVQSACVLDAAGVQITDTVWRPQSAERERTVIFQPPARGADHSLKEYFYLLPATRPGPADVYETAPYVPLPNTDICVTLSTAFRPDGVAAERSSNGGNGSADQEATYVLCLHMDAVLRPIFAADTVPVPGVRPN